MPPRSLSLRLAIALSPVLSAVSLPAAVVVSFNGTGYVGSNTTYLSVPAAAASTTFTGSIPFSLSSAWSIPNYTGPTIHGGVFYEAVNSAPKDYATRGVAVIRNDDTLGDYLRFQDLATTTDVSQVRRYAVLIGATGSGPYGFGSTSAFSLTAGPSSSTDELRWLVVNGGTLYVSSQSFNPSANQTYGNTEPLSSMTFAAWTPAANLLPEGLTYSVPGSSFDAITHAGFLGLRSSTGSALGTQDIRYFSADLATVAPIPEPSTFVFLASFGALGLAFWRRRT